MVYAVIASVLGGGLLSYLYASKVIADYEKAASKVGVAFRKVEGEVVAIYTAAKADVKKVL